MLEDHDEEEEESEVDEKVNEVRDRITNHADGQRSDIGDPITADHKIVNEEGESQP